MPFHPVRRGLRSLSLPFLPDNTRLRQGVGSLPRPQTSEDDPEDPPLRWWQKGTTQKGQQMLQVPDASNWTRGYRPEEGSGLLPPSGRGGASIGPTPSWAQRMGRQILAMPKRVSDFATGAWHGFGPWSAEVAEQITPGDPIFKPGELEEIRQYGEERIPETPSGGYGAVAGALGGEFTPVGGFADLTRVPGYLGEGQYLFAALAGMEALPGVPPLMKAMKRTNVPGEIATGMSGVWFSRLNRAIERGPKKATGDEWKKHFMRSEDVTPPHPTRGKGGKTKPLVDPSKYPPDESWRMLDEPGWEVGPRGTPRQYTEIPRDFPQGEGDWRGVGQYLADNADTELTRADMLEFARANEVQITEILKPRLLETVDLPGSSAEGGIKKEWGVRDPSTGEILSRHSTQGRAEARIVQYRNADAFDENAPGWWSANAESTRSRPKYPAETQGEYGLKKVSNYREYLLKFHPPDPIPTKAIRKLPHGEPKAGSGQYGYYEILDERGGVITNVTFGPDNLPGMTETEALEEAARRIADTGNPPRWNHPDDFVGGHYPNERNVLVHLRTTDRWIGGKKVLFIEEIQSDWHQKGRLDGYRPTREEMRVLSEEVETLREQLNNYPARPVESDQSWSYQRTLDERLSASDPEYNALLTDFYDARDRLEIGAVPDAPFKGSNEWAGLAARRAIQAAVDGGYDRIAWATGEQTASLYPGLRREVSRIDWTPNSGGPGPISGRLIVLDKDGWTWIDENLGSVDEVENIIGKDQTAQLLRAPTYDSNAATPVSLPGEPPIDPSLLASPVLPTKSLRKDLTIGGEGIIYFYDNILRDVMRAEANRLGGALEDVSLIGPLRVGGRLQPTTNSSMAITPEVRKTVKESGFRLWSAGALLGVGGAYEVGQGGEREEREEPEELEDLSWRPPR